MKLPNHKTKIVCTIGPASESQEVMERMIVAGMNIARLNFSHGDFSTHKRAIENLRAAAAAAGRGIAIMADLSGPKIRIGEVSPEPIELVPGQAFILTTEDIVGEQEPGFCFLRRFAAGCKTGRHPVSERRLYPA